MAWRATLSHLIAIESGRWPSEHRSDSERDDLIASVQRSRMSYGVNVRSMRLLAKPKTLALTRNELRTLRCKLRKAVKFYQLAHAEPLPTPTDRRKLLTNVKTAAVQLSKSPRSEVWAKRLAENIQAARTDTGAETLLTKALARGTRERFGKLTALLGELDAIVRLAGRLTARWLEPTDSQGIGFHGLGFWLSYSSRTPCPFASSCPTRDSPISLLIWSRYGVE